MELHEWSIVISPYALASGSKLVPWKCKPVVHNLWYLAEKTEHDTAADGKQICNQIVHHLKCQRSGSHKVDHVLMLTTILINFKYAQH